MVETNSKLSPLPGDFMSTEDNTRREDSNLQGKEQDILNTTELKENFSLPTQKEEKELYLKGLKLANLTKEQAVAILDATIVNGIYTENIKICNRIDVILGTRTYRDLQRASQLIDNAEVNLPMHVNDLIARYNLAASLRGYADKIFDFPTDPTKATEQFQIRLDFIYSLPEVIVNQLIQHLHVFDFKVSAVFAKGAPEDF